MATEGTDFTDILSAALDESGITGDENFDFDFSEPVAAQTPAVPPAQAHTPIHVPETIQVPPPVVQQGTPVIVNGRSQARPPGGLTQEDIFSQALKQLAANNNIVRPASRIITTTSSNPNPTSSTPVSILNRSASTPAIIKLPSNASQETIMSHLPQLLRQQSAQAPGNGAAGNRTKIITVKRVGPNGSVTQSRSFTLSGNGALNGGQKIILKQANGQQQIISTTGQLLQGIQQQTVSTSPATIRLPQNVQLQTRPAAREAQPSLQTPQASINNVNKMVTQAILGRSDGKSIVVNRTFPQTATITSRSPSLANITSQIVSSNSSNGGTVRVINRPFISNNNSGSVLHHSQSYPSNLTNIPKHIIDDDSFQRNSPSPVHHQLVSPVTLSGGKIIPGSQQTVVTLQNGLGLSSLSGMQKSVSSMSMMGNSSSKVNISNKDLTRLLSNPEFKLKNLSSFGAQNSANQSRMRQLPSNLLELEEGEEEAEQLGQAETYNEYMPQKLKIGVKHPDAVVETSSMSSIESCDIHYKLSIPESTIDYGELSALQLESIVYACQRHQIILPCGDRAGFLIGDGAGVGKGRTVAGIIFENYILGRKRALWLSVSNDLRIDAERDLHDIGATKIDVHPLNKFKYAKISSKENGSVKKGVIFATYSSLIGESHSDGKYKTRLKQLLKWCGKEFDGVIVLDECHKAKNLCPVGSSKPTKTGQTVLELQKRLPKARIVYASATGATETKNMAYMTRLGLWGEGTPFKVFMDFIQAVEKRGVGAMELVAMDMKLRGIYIARQLSFKGVSFKIDEIPVDKDFQQVYNEAVKLWVDAREMFQSAAELIDAENRMRKSMWGQFWSGHQRFFKYLCISAKVRHCVQIAREAVRDGKCVVIGLQSTGEARTLEQLEESGGELNDFVSTAKGVFQTLIDKHFPAPDRRKTFDIFGLGGSSSYNEDSNQSSSSRKRKKDQSLGNAAKKLKGSESSNGDSDSDSVDSDIDFGLSDLSDSSSDNDDFNPFGGGSDSDDDPWLKKTKSSKKAKEKKKKEKKKKEKKKKKKKSKEKDMDEEFDKALAAAGLLKKADTNGSGSNTTGDAVEKACNMKRELLERIEMLGDRLPPNTIDQLIDDLGGTDNVAEMTGRKGRVVCTDEGISYESRSESDVPLEILNLTEKQRFMDGEKNIAIISEAASSGISLQADRRVINQKRRVHITLELPWSADRAIQQFGRTHRSNQVSAPEYIFLISGLAGEQRFASTVSKRLESLGALTHGDRRATESRDLSRFNFDNKFGRVALESVMKSICGFENPAVPPPEYENGGFFKDAKIGLIGVGMIIEPVVGSVPILEKDYSNISKFLNRLLGIEVCLQNAIFQYFSNTLTSIILEAKRSGRWDLGILDLGSGGESVKKIETKVFLGNTATNTAKTELTTVSVERGMSFPQAVDIWRKYQGVNDGFYLSCQERMVRKFAVLIAYQGAYNKKKEKLFTVYRPNTGLQPRQETLPEIKKKYRQCLPDEAQKWWEEQYNASATTCSHAYWRGSCRKVTLGLPCEIGLRSRTYHVLGGSVLSVWNMVENVLASMPGGSNTKMQIIRLRTDDKQRIVGSLIPSNCIDPLCNVLTQASVKTYTEKPKQEELRPLPKEEHQAVDTLSMPLFL